MKVVTDYSKLVAPVAERIAREVNKMTANETQVGGTHYSKYKAVQPWDLWWMWNLNPFQAAILKYIVRYRDKDGIKDLEKAQHFLTKLMEVETNKGKQ